MSVETLIEIINSLKGFKLLQITGVIIVFLLIILIAIIVSKGESKSERQSRLAQQQKIISELQNITSRQQDFVNKIRETNDQIFRQTEVLKEIQKQTRTESYVEKEELKKKIEEINKMMKV